VTVGVERQRPDGRVTVEVERQRPWRRAGWPPREQKPGRPQRAERLARPGQGHGRGGNPEPSVLAALSPGSP